MYDLITATSMGVRITPPFRQPVGIGNEYVMQSTSAESNVLNISASLGLKTKVLTAFVSDSPIAAFIRQDSIRRGGDGGRNSPGWPPDYRHQLTSPTRALASGPQITTTGQAKWAGR